MMFLNKYLIWISASAFSSVCGGFFYLKNNNNRPNNYQNVVLSEEEEYIDLPEIFKQLNDALMNENKNKNENEKGKEISSSPTIAIENLFSKLELFIKLRNELESLKYSQTSDYNQSIRLARSNTEHIDFNRFRSPISVDKISLRLNGEIHHFELNELVVHLLKCLLETNHQSECSNFLTRQALVLFEHQFSLNDIFFFHEYNNQSKDKEFHIQMKRYKTLFFQSIWQNIQNSENLAQCLLDNGLLLAFHKIRQTFPETNILRWISSCLSALSYYEISHQHFYHTGWIRILAEWIRGPDWHLKLEAAKTLHNMSHKTESFYPSVYLLWPIFDGQDNSTLEYDIIFIHGLKGGVLKTWRQSDKMKKSPDYTECWPQSWLAKDFSNCRILAINYDSYLSSWNISCSSDEFTIKDRSLKLIEELKDAGVGSRPIIWITHSMGGLFVKHMLTHLNNGGNSLSSGHRSVLDQTKAIVFYSVPHKGSEMAVWSQNVERLISPSTHVLELRKDCSKLINLHEEFVQLAKEKQIDLLSFGETEKCTLLQSPIEWRALLVPEESANPGIGKFVILSEDHFNICKPIDKNSNSYKELKKFLSEVLVKDYNSASGIFNKKK